MYQLSDIMETPQKKNLIAFILVTPKFMGQISGFFASFT